MKKVILFLCAIFSMVCVSAQTLIYKDNIPNNRVFSLAMDGDILWLGTNGGIVKFSKTTEEFINYTEISDSSIKGYLGSTIISVAVNNKGELYTTGDGVIYYNGTDWQRYTSQNSDLPSNETRYVTFDKNNNLWVGTSGYMCSFKDNIWQNYRLMYDPLLSHFSINECDFDSENNVWVGTSEGLYKIENDIVESINDFVFGQINSLKVRGDSVVIGTKSKGLLIYTPNDGKTTEYNSVNSILKSNWVQYVYPNERSYYVITGNALFLFDNGRFTAYMDKDSLLNNLVLNKVLPDGDVLWLATANNGLYKYNLKTNICEKKAINENCKFNSFCVDSLGCMYFIDSNEPCSLKIKDDSGWLVITKNDLEYLKQNFNVKYSSDTLNIYERNEILIYFLKDEFLGIYHNSPQNGGDVKIDRHNIIYQISSNGGYWAYNGSWTKYSKDNSIIPTQYLSNLCFDNLGKLWFSADPGLDTITREILPGALISKDDVDFEVISMPEIPGIIDNNSIINCIYIDQNNTLWIGVANLFTRGVANGYGLFKYDGNSWTNFTIENSGLSSNIINCINSYGGDLYLGTSGGGISVFNISSGNWKTYNCENSILPRNTVNSIDFDIYGNMYINIEFYGVIKSKIDIGVSQINEKANLKTDQITVFPNPTTDFVTIKSQNIITNNIQMVNIYDLSGKLLASKNISAINNNMVTISLKELSIKNGLYILEIIKDKKSFIFNILLL